MLACGFCYYSNVFGSKSLELDEIATNSNGSRNFLPTIPQVDPDIQNITIPSPPSSNPYQSLVPITSRTPTLTMYETNNQYDDSLTMIRQNMLRQLQKHAEREVQQIVKSKMNEAKQDINQTVQEGKTEIKTVKTEMTQDLRQESDDLIDQLFAYIRENTVPIIQETLKNEFCKIMSSTARLEVDRLEARVNLKLTELSLEQVDMQLAASEFEQFCHQRMVEICNLGINADEYSNTFKESMNELSEIASRIEVSVISLLKEPLEEQKQGADGIQERLEDSVKQLQTMLSTQIKNTWETLIEKDINAFYEERDEMLKKEIDKQIKTSKELLEKFKNLKDTLDNEHNAYLNSFGVDKKSLLDLTQRLAASEEREKELENENEKLRERVAALEQRVRNTEDVEQRLAKLEQKILQSNSENAE